MDPVAPVTHPTPSEFRLDGTTYVVRPGVNTENLILQRGRRTVAIRYPDGQMTGPARQVFDQIQAGLAILVVRCVDCGRELTDAESKARRVGPDCWAARRPA